MEHEQPDRKDLDITHATTRTEIRRRVPWMVLALLAGAAMVLVGRQFEESLGRRLELALFIPMIVYISDTIGTETLAVGLALGIATGVPMGPFSYVWLQDLRFSMTILVAMIANGLVAVLTGMLIPIVFARLKKDPALGTDELTTAISDNASLLIYLLVATLILFPS